MNENETGLIYGRNAVLEALKADRMIECLYTQKGDKNGSIVQILQLAAQKKLLVKEVPKPKLDEMTDNANHQGITAVVQAYPYVEVEDLLARAKEKGEAPFLVICESVQDPHNLGAILRSADALGVHGVIIAKHHAVGLTEGVAKTAAGACEYVPVAKVTNIPQTVEKLKALGVWVASADMDGEEAAKCNLTGAIALVIGGENEGVSRLTRERSDYIIRIPMSGHVNSLNASVAGGILVYEIQRQRMMRA